LLSARLESGPAYRIMDSEKKSREEKIAGDLSNIIGAEYLEDLVERFGPDMLKMDDFDDCLAGVVVRFGQEPILCYDHEKLIKKMSSDGMTEEEAEEWWEFNQLGAWCGTATPCFLIK
jgi:hypothetical protein